MEIYIPTIGKIIQVLYENISSLIIDLSLPQSLIYLTSTYIIGYLFYKFVSKKSFDDFKKDALSKEIWLSNTAFVDYAFFLLFVLGISTGIVFGNDIVSETKNFISQNFPVSNSIGYLPGLLDNIPFMILWTLLFVVLVDFMHFFAHWVEHRFRFFWYFHSTHHSASHLNPFVAFRIHPVELLIVRFLKLVMAPVIFSMITFYLFGVHTPVYLFYGVPLYFFVYYLYTNIRHTEVWVKFPRKLSYIFCSPAMHQIHHSNDPKWHGKNMSFLFSFWDWIFGTIYIPKDEDKEILEFGLLEDENIPAGSFTSNLVNPFTNLYKWVVKN